MTKILMLNLVSEISQNIILGKSNTLFFFLRRTHFNFSIPNEISTLDLFEFPYLLHKEKNPWNESLGYSDPGEEKLGKWFVYFLLPWERKGKKKKKISHFSSHFFLQLYYMFKSRPPKHSKVLSDNEPMMFPREGADFLVSHWNRQQRVQLNIP